MTRRVCPREVPLRAGFFIPSEQDDRSSDDSQPQDASANFLAASCKCALYNPLVPIVTRRFDEPAATKEDLRILITRYRPRGVAKADETWDEWRPNLGPSKDLLARFKGKIGEGLDWATYRRVYLSEMKSQTEQIDELARRLAAGETISLLCSSSCLREARCHRSLLRELIETRERDL
jgi:uncharacterized protein YeaO (DUF488 family)